MRQAPAKHRFIPSRKHPEQKQYAPENYCDDQLGETETIRNGRSRTFEVTAGQWDMMALDCDQDEIDTRWEQDVNGPYDWTIE